jgi:hypothetical protein
MFELWVHHAEGIGTPVDPAEATRWLAAAADAGHPRALYNVGAGHAQGTWGAVDFAKAATCYELAANAGHARAAATLAVMILTGQVLGTPEQAATWLDRADTLGVRTKEMLAEAGLADPRAGAPQ